MGHGAIGVMRQGLAETGHRFHMIVAVHPVQAPVEPELGGGRTRGDGAAKRAEVKVVHVASNAVCDMSVGVLVGFYHT